MLNTKLKFNIRSNIILKCTAIALCTIMRYVKLLTNMIRNALSSIVSRPFIFYMNFMLSNHTFRQCYRPLAILLLLLPVCLFLLFGIMEEKMMPQSLSLPTPYSVIPLYPSRVPLIDLKHFFYLINNDVCKQDKVYIVAIVHSHPANRELRDVMRRNIPMEDLVDIGVRRVFLLARAEWQDQDLYRRTPQDKISEENVLHGDIIQGNFKEHYRNLTYKHMMGLQWVGKFCPQAKYIIKMDDDIIVDLYQIRDRLKYRYESRKNLILGLLQVEARPIRANKSKWFVSKDEFPGEMYNNFVSGWAYAISRDAAKKIVKASFRRPFFWVDDVHVTGTLAEDVGIKREGLNRFYTLHTTHLQCCVELPHHADYLCDFMVGPSEGNITLMEELLQHARACFISHCSRRPPEQSIIRTCVTAKIPPLMPPTGRGYAEIIKIH